VNVRYLPIVVALGILWGSTFLFVKVLIDETTPVAIVTARSAFAVAAMAVILVVRRIPLPMAPGTWAKVSVMAVFNSILPLLLIAWGQERVEAGTAAVLNATMPLVTAVLAAMVLADERLTFAKVAGIVVGIIGVIVFTGGEILDLGSSDAIGQLAIIAGTASWAVNAVYARAFLRSDNLLGISTLHFLIALLIMIPVVSVVNPPADFNMSLKAWGSVFAMGAVLSAGGYAVFLWLIHKVGPVYASLNSYVIPISGLFLGWAILDEDITWETILGCAIIILGVALVISGRLIPLGLSPFSAEKAPPLGALPVEPAD